MRLKRLPSKAQQHVLDYVSANLARRGGATLDLLTKIFRHDICRCSFGGSHKKQPFEALWGDGCNEVSLADVFIASAADLQLQPEQVGRTVWLVSIARRGSPRSWRNLATSSYVPLLVTLADPGSPIVQINEQENTRETKSK